MAKASYDALKDNHLTPPEDWRCLNDSTQDAFMDVGKRCYAVIALKGGARLHEIEDPE
jgi:hypothetical protein